MMSKKCIALPVLIFAIQIASGQRISYIVSFPNLSHHEARISLVVSGLTTRSAIFRMSRSSPGRYATHEFGKNIYDIQAFDQQNAPLTISIGMAAMDDSLSDGYQLVERADEALYAAKHAGKNRVVAHGDRVFSPVSVPLL